MPDTVGLQKQANKRDSTLNRPKDRLYLRLFSRRLTAGSSFCLDFQKAAQRSPDLSMRCRMEDRFHVCGETLAVSSLKVIGVEIGACGNARTE